MILSTLGRMACFVDLCSRLHIQLINCQPQLPSRALLLPEAAHGCHTASGVPVWVNLQALGLSCCTCSISLHSHACVGARACTFWMPRGGMVCMTTAAWHHRIQHGRWPISKVRSISNCAQLGPLNRQRTCQLNMQQESHQTNCAHV